MGTSFQVKCEIFDKLLIDDAAKKGCDLAFEITAIKKAKYNALILPAHTLVYERDKNRIKVFMQDNEVTSFLF